MWRTATLMAGFALFLETKAAHPWSLGAKLALVLFAAYVPFYLDGSSLEGTRCGPSVGASRFAAFFWTKILGE